MAAVPAAVATAIAIAVLAGHAAAWVPATWVLVATLQAPPLSSTCALAAAVLMLRVSRGTNRRHRLWLAVAVLALFVGSTGAAPLTLQRSGNSYMGDGLDFATSRAKFEQNIPVAGDRQALHFKAHLGDAILAIVDRAFGRTSRSPATAYEIVSRLGGLLFVAELLTVVIAWKASRRACRFAAVALALPVVIGFFGYYELGYLAVSVGAFPLLVLALRARGEGFVSGSGALQGLHAALHGFGLLGIAGGVLASYGGRHAPSVRTLRALQFAAWASAAYLGWIAIYVVGLKLTVESDPAAGNIAIRALTEVLIFDRRVMHPLLSANAVREIGAASLAVGVPLLVAGALGARVRSERLTMLLYALPGMLFMIFWWPSLGVRQDMDLLLGAFPGAAAAAWLASRTHQAALRGLAVLAVAHVMFWSAVVTPALARVWVD